MSTRIFYEYNNRVLVQNLYHSNNVDTGVIPPPPTVNYLLQENGFYILQEDGSKIIIT